MANLLVNSDDFGLHPSVNEAIENCVQFGSVNSISVITNGSAPDYELLRKLYVKTFIGLHLTWVGEPWLTQKIFIPDWKALLKKVMLGGSRFRNQLLEEAKAQMQELLQNGIVPDHIDSHQHVHHFPFLWDIVLNLQHKNRISRIRVAHVKSPGLMRMGVAGFGLNIRASMIQQPAGFYAAGIRHAGNYNGKLLSAELRLAAGADTELIVHPGTDNNALDHKYGHWKFDWEREYAILTSNDFTKLISDNGFKLMKKEVID